MLKNERNFDINIFCCYTFIYQSKTSLHYYSTIRIVGYNNWTQKIIFFKLIWGIYKKKYQNIITMFADLNKDLKNCKYTNFYPLVRQNLRGGPSLLLPLFIPGTLSVNHDNLLICYMELVLCSEKNFHQSFLTFLQIEKTFTFKSPFCGNYYSEAAAYILGKSPITVY